MGTGPWIISIALLLFGVSLWSYRLSKKHDADKEIISQLETKVAQHKILIADLQTLIEDDEDLNKCLADEIEDDKWATAREVAYEQNKERWDADNPESPWVPRESPK